VPDKDIVHKGNLSWRKVSPPTYDGEKEKTILVATEFDGPGMLVKVSSISDAFQAVLRVFLLHAYFHGHALQFPTDELATEFQLRVGAVLNDVGLPLPTTMAQEIESYEIIVEDQKFNQKKFREAQEAASDASTSFRASGSVRTRTPRPESQGRRRSQAFGNKSTFEHQATFAAPSSMDTSMVSPSYSLPYLLILPHSVPSPGTLR
jgi:hypothetical protein